MPTLMCWTVVIDRRTWEQRERDEMKRRRRYRKLLRKQRKEATK